MDRIATLHAEPPSAQSYQQIADAYDELHHALKQTTIDTSELDKAARRYAKHLQRIEGEARNYANALQRLERAIETQANAEQANAEQALERIRKRAEKLTDTTKSESRRFAEVCRPRR